MNRIIQETMSTLVKCYINLNIDIFSFKILNCSFLSHMLLYWSLLILYIYVYIFYLIICYPFRIKYETSHINLHIWHLKCSLNCLYNKSIWWDLYSSIFWSFVSATHRRYFALPALDIYFEYTTRYKNCHYPQRNYVIF